CWAALRPWALTVLGTTRERLPGQARSCTTGSTAPGGARTAPTTPMPALPSRARRASRRAGAASILTSEGVTQGCRTGTLGRASPSLRQPILGATDPHDTPRDAGPGPWFRRVSGSKVFAVPPNLPGFHAGML